MDLKQLEWNHKKDYDGKDSWTARNDITGGWLDSYDICTMGNGEFRVWGLMRNRHRREGEAFVGTLDEAKGWAEDDYRRRQRAEAWREYMETNDPPREDKPILERIKTSRLLAEAADMMHNEALGIPWTSPRGQDWRHFIHELRERAEAFKQIEDTP